LFFVLFFDLSIILDIKDIWVKLSLEEQKKRDEEGYEELTCCGKLLY
jgi:hypothetical protein